jgi:hypothetical protein
LKKDPNAVHCIPVLEGDPWHITGYPDLGELAEGQEHEVVDHAIWQALDGKWQCWACVRKTRVGRLLYAWEGDSLEQPDWEPMGVAMRVDRSRGESVNDWVGEEWIQAPHVIRHADLYYMFYGAHNTELGECQICLATSADGRRFERHVNGQGFSRVFVGPGEVRDPMVRRIGDRWVCYYTGHDTGKRRPCKVYARSSHNLIDWSEFREVSWGGFTSGADLWSAECPHVIVRDGYYYLFRTSEYRAPARTHVYCSRDPFDFGLGSDSKLVATLRLAAPEVMCIGDQCYISTVEDLKGGIQVFKLGWL